MGWILGILAALVLFVVLPFACASIPNEQTAENYLETNGWSDIEYVGRAPYATFQGCSDDDAVIFTFNATNPAGKPIDGVKVCQGWPLGGAHLRGR